MKNIIDFFKYLFIGLLGMFLMTFNSVLYVFFVLAVAAVELFQLFSSDDKQELERENEQLIISDVNA